MKSTLDTLAAFALISILSAPAAAQNRPEIGLNSLSHIRVLASDSLEGRRSGLPGGEKAAAWIAARFAEYGLRPGVNDSSFFQDFRITTAVESGPMTLRLLPDGRHPDPLSFRYGSDFVSFAYGGENRVSGEVVFVGYGIHEPDKGRDDFAGLDLRGKIALALAGSPPTEGEGYWGREGGHGYKASHSRDLGAVGYLQAAGDKAMQRTLGLRNRRADLPAFWISRSACDRLLQGTGLTLDSLRTMATANPGGFHLELPCRLELEAHAGVLADVPTRNVLGYIPGADPALAHEIVLIGAHMDHLGVDAVGRIYPGADDNASGTALVLEAARMLAHDPIPPRRSVYFCAFAGEDLGLLGSQEFVEHPPVALDSIVTMINIDMVGRGAGGIELGGAPNFPQIWAIWKTALDDSTCARMDHFKPGYYSDHAPFEEVGIPAFFVASKGDHPQYHQVEDRADSIQIAPLQETGEIVYRGLRALADYPAPLAHPNRLRDYLRRNAEIVALGAPPLPVRSNDDTPDVILYEAGKRLDPSSPSRLRRLLVELENLKRLRSDDEAPVRVESLSGIPTGRLDPALILGIASPSLTENEAEIYSVLSRLGVLFVHVPREEQRGYFGGKGLNQTARRRLQELTQAPQMVIWDVEDFRQAQALLQAAQKPLLLRIRQADAALLRDLRLDLNGSFLWLETEGVRGWTQADFDRALASFGRYRIGIRTEDPEDADRLIALWLDAGYDQQKVTDLLGGNLVRWMQRRPG
jgi:hypothetical protein